MNLREILQYEIWSKNTSRKILIGIGIAVASVLLISGAWDQIQRHLLTSGERKAAQEALARIDSLYDAQSLGVEGLETREALAAASVHTAKAVVKTRRDYNVSMDLDVYLAGVWLKLNWRQGRSSYHASERAKSDLENSIRNQRRALHEILD